jgi:hypothetical protein
MKKRDENKRVVLCPACGACPEIVFQGEEILIGEKDNIVPISLVKKNFNAYKDKNSLRTFKEFANRGHYICNQPDWEEVASYVAAWVK